MESTNAHNCMLQSEFRNVKMAAAHSTNEEMCYYECHNRWSGECSQTEIWLWDDKAMMRILNEEFLVAMVEEEVRNTILRGEKEKN